MKNVLAKLSVMAAALAASVAFATPAALADPQRDSRSFRGEPIRISCGSSEFNYRACTLPRGIRADIADARLVRRVSHAYCDRGRDWGIGRDGVWVRNGCRAVFEVYLDTRNNGRRDVGRRDDDRNDRRFDDRGNDRNGNGYDTRRDDRRDSNRNQDLAGGYPRGR